MIILDTNVVSELTRPAPGSAVVGWVRRQAATNLFLTAVTEAELRYGVEILPAGRRRNAILTEVEGVIGEDFAGRILPFDTDAARSYALIVAARRAAGAPISQSDAQIAAIARSRGATVATRDAGGFSGCGIEVINPWRA